ncbi:MAG: nucleoside recognition domain-containing protein [Bacteroidota bacterium]
MLNYIWFGLIAIALVVGVGSDINDEAKNTYRNGVPLEILFDVHKAAAMNGTMWEGEFIVPAESFNKHYGITSAAAEVRQPATLNVSKEGKGTFLFSVGDATPALWKTMSKAAGAKDRLSGRVESVSFSEDKGSATASIVFESIRFVKIKAITQAALDFANIAVELSIGLIGIMALWLGLIKIAEAAGLVLLLTRLLAPITKRLFPDVPPDHPAVGAMIMNMAANMLGLNNAATPMGLKAMEELNKINPKPGTATNAMVTFLTINTGGLVLIPATAIAVRAASGSVNPGIIIGTSIVGAGCATIAGIIASKLLQRLPRYKKELLIEEEEVKVKVKGGING